MLFLPGKAFFSELLQKNKIIGHAWHGSDGLFYISDNEWSTSVESIDKGKTVQKMMAAVDAHFEGT